MTIATTDNQPPRPASGQRLAATAFRELLDAFANVHVLEERDPRHEAARRKRDEVRAMIEHHTKDAAWRDRLHRAQEAAQRGEHEFLLLRFPSSQCTDKGHAINIGDSTWPATLTGEAADLYRVWSEELRPAAFHLTARILEYPHGNQGDAGLILSWASHA
jgi:hypothetical protein